MNYDADKKRVLEWMEKYCPGHKSARTRKDILPFIGLPDRYFRSIASELIHEGNLCSTASKGYWFRPLKTNDPEEIEAIKHSILERKSKALSMLEDCKAQMEELEKMTQGQLQFTI